MSSMFWGGALRMALHYFSGVLLCSMIMFSVDSVAEEADFVKDFYKYKQYAYGDGSPDELKDSARNLDKVIGGCYEKSQSLSCKDFISSFGDEYRKSFLIFDGYLEEMRRLHESWLQVKEIGRLGYLDVSGEGILRSVCDDGSECKSLLSKYDDARRYYGDSCPSGISQGEMWVCINDFSLLADSYHRISKYGDDVMRIVKTGDATGTVLDSVSLDRVLEASRYINEIELLVNDISSIEDSIKSFGGSFCVDKSGKQTGHCKDGVPIYYSMLKLVKVGMLDYAIDHEGNARIKLDEEGKEKKVNASKLMDAIREDGKEYYSYLNERLIELRPWYFHSFFVVSIFLLNVVIIAFVLFNVRRREALLILASEAIIILVALSYYMRPGKGVFTDEMICKATIAAEFGKAPSIIDVSSYDEGVYYLSYIRESDLTRWNFRCMMSGDQPIWASLTGPWRIREDDGRVEFSVNDDLLTIRIHHSDGSSTVKAYRHADLN